MRKLLTFLFILCLAVSLSAQMRTGNITGKIVDPEGNPLPGVTVTLSGSLMSPLAVVTNQDGAFRFMSLSSGKDYNLKAELTGFKTKSEEGIIVSIGNTTSLTLTMEIGVIEQQIVVTAQTPVVDTKKTTIGQSLDREALQSLPTSRDPYAVLQMAPSVMVDRENVAGMESGQGASFIGRGGASVFEGQGNNAWAMDGVIITDPSSLSSPGYYDFDAFEEINVSVGGSDVSSQTGGINVNLVSRRGGNKVTLGARFMDTDSKFQANNLTDELIAEGFEGTNRVNTIKDYGFNLGLPIIKDRAWFWGSYGIQDIKTYLITGAADDTLLVNYAAKLNLQIVPQNRFEAFIHAGKKEKWGRNAGTTFPRGYHQMGKFHFGSPIIKFQDEHMFGDDLLLSAQYSWINSGFQMIPWADENLEQLRTLNVQSGVWERSYNYNIYDRPSTNVTVKGTYFNDTLFGLSHEVKFGVDYSQRNQVWTNGQGPGNAILRYNYHTRTIDVNGDGRPDVARDYGVNISNVNIARGNDNQYNLWGYGLFFSDTLSKGRFSVILGLRYDEQHPYYKSFTMPVVDPSNPVWQDYFGAGVADAMSRILPGLNIPENKPDFSYKTFSPRLGLTWDVTGDGKNVAKLSFAKYGDYMGVGFAANFYPLGRGGTANFWWIDGNRNTTIDLSELYWNWSTNYQIYRAFDDAGNFVGNWDDGFIAGRWAGYDPQDPQAIQASDTILDANVNSSNTWEALFSFEKEVLPDLGVSLNMTYRRYDNYTYFLPYDPETGKKWGWDDYVQVGTIPDQVGTYSTGEAAGKPYYMLKAGVDPYNYTYGSIQPDRYDQYFGMDLVVVKRLSNNWMVNGSLTWQMQKAHYGQDGWIDPNVQNFDPVFFNPVPNPSNHWAVDGQTYAALVGGRSGKVNSYIFSPWLVKLGGLYKFPLDINASFTFSAQQGPIIAKSVTIVDYNAPNPADTAVDVYLEKFGTSHMPMIWNLNFRVEKMLKIGDIGRVYLMADLFNSFNRSTIMRRYDMQVGTYYVQDGTFAPNATSNLPYEIIAPRVVRFGIRFDF